MTKDYIIGNTEFKINITEYSNYISRRYKGYVNDGLTNNTIRKRIQKMLVDYFYANLKCYTFIKIFFLKKINEVVDDIIDRIHINLILINKTEK